MVVLITGASSGIGRALASAYARRGAKLVLFARRKDRLEALAEECQRLGGQAIAYAGDVAKVTDLEAAVEVALQKFGCLDIAVANAGVAIQKKISELEDAELARQLEVNLFGVLRTLRVTIPHLRRSQGRAVIVGSGMSYIPIAGAGAYTMSKFAVRAMAETLRLEERRVSVTLICQGFIESEIRAIDNQGNFRHDAKEQVPAWMIMTAERAAEEIVAAVERRKAEYAITWYTKLGILLQRLAPRLMERAWRQIR